MIRRLDYLEQLSREYRERSKRLARWAALADAEQQRERGVASGRRAETGLRAVGG